MKAHAKIGVKCGRAAKSTITSSPTRTSALFLALRAARLCAAIALRRHATARCAQPSPCAGTPRLLQCWSPFAALLLARSHIRRPAHTPPSPLQALRKLARAWHAALRIEANPMIQDRQMRRCFRTPRALLGIASALLGVASVHRPVSRRPPPCTAVLRNTAVCGFRAGGVCLRTLLMGCVAGSSRVV